ncbi:radical SAM/SPASM domain-containing protein [Desulfovibrio inopinatus]|uniref:radical SAM/SPASM domain-containing protein n=1 Tax=Desulfovibrio inopinatus TaxID=102109 RepID=UPI0004172F92|nr:radical SAM/SPASM domain-containing protein [Desulfovibrio inopinatus]
MQKNIENLGSRKNFRNTVHEVLGDENESGEIFYKYAMVWMSRKCNSRCKYCYQDGDPEANNASWSYEKADKVTSLLLDDGYHVQPLINEWLPEFWNFLELMKKCQWNEITTNGLILLSRHQEFFPLLREYEISDIRHTLFPKGIHEEMTGRDREKSLRAIQLSKEHGFRTIVNYVVTTETLPHIVEVCDELADMEVDEIQFMNLIYLGRSKSKKNELLDMQYINKFWDTWKLLSENPKYERIEFDFQANFGPNPHGDNVSKRAAKQSRFCLAGKNERGHFIYITPEDDIYPCFLLSDPKFKIGKIIENGNNYSLEYNDADWIKHIPSFNRSHCAGTQYITRAILS